MEEQKNMYARYIELKGEINKRQKEMDDIKKAILSQVENAPAEIIADQYKFIVEECERKMIDKKMLEDAGIDTTKYQKISTYLRLTFKKWA